MKAKRSRSKYKLTQYYRTAESDSQKEGSDRSDRGEEGEGGEGRQHYDRIRNAKKDFQAIVYETNGEDKIPVKNVQADKKTLP